MKSYDETINTVLDRIGEYKTAQKRKKKIITRTVLPVCSVTLAAAIGIGAWQSGIFKSKSSVTLEDSTVIGEKDYIGPDELDDDIKTDTSEPEQNKTLDDISDRATYSTSSNAGNKNGVADILGSVVIDGITYIQYNADENSFTIDTYLGDARNFEGSYNSSFNDISTELYTVKESKNVLIVKLENGGTVVLGRFGELVVNGNTYFSSDWNPTEFTQDKYLGTADDFEIIDVPYREKRINPQDEIWTAKEDDDILLIKQSDRNITVFCVTDLEIQTSCIKEP